MNKLNDFEEKFLILKNKLKDFKEYKNLIAYYDYIDKIYGSIKDNKLEILDEVVDLFGKLK